MKRSKQSTTPDNRLLSFIQRVERLDEERRQIVADIAEVKKGAASAGYDVKVLNQMLRERRMGDSERQEWQALCETYRAALGMLDGTPLGDHARRRLTGEEPDAPNSTSHDAEDPGPPLPFEPDEAAPPSDGEASAPSEPPKPSQEDILSARAQGSAAALAGKKVTANPFPAGDARRAAWDEGFCAAAGTDGMDIPPAWRRRPKRSGDDAGAAE